MHRRRPLLKALPSLAAGALLAGCATTGVVVSSAPHADDPKCTQVASHWPAQVADQDERPVGHAKAAAAWGDPAIIARCGVPMPAPNVDCLDVNGVDWVMTDLSDGKKFVTYGRWPAVEVLLPDGYLPTELAKFTEAAKAAPQGSQRCT